MSPRSQTRIVRAAPALALLAALAASAAEAGEFTLRPSEIVERKAVFGQVAARDVAPARARIGGTLTELSVTEGSLVNEGQVVARVVDDKLAIQLQAAEARIQALQSQIANAKQEAERAATLTARGVGTQQSLDAARTQVDVLDNQIAAAEADRAVIARQSSEGEVLAPTTGRVVRAPLTKGAVVLPGDAVVTIDGGGLYLRLALPEREAPLLSVGQRVDIDKGGVPVTGRIVKLYPQIEAGRLQADVEVADLSDFYVGQRQRVSVPVAKRMALLVPAAAVSTRSGLDFVTIRDSGGAHEVAVVLGAPQTRDGEDFIEALSGLRAGDVVVTP